MLHYNKNTFVANFGNDYDGDGNYTTPFATITKACSKAASGTIITVVAGTYYCNRPITANGIWIKALDEDRVIIKGIIEVRGTNNIFEKLEIENTAIYGNNNTVRGCYLINGIYVAERLTGIELLQNKLFAKMHIVSNDHAFIFGNEIVAGSEGIILEKCTDSTIRMNNIKVCINIGIYVYNGRDLIIADNFISECQQGITLLSDDVITGCHILFNIVRKCPFGLVILRAHKNIFENNTFFNGKIEVKSFIENKLSKNIFDCLDVRLADTRNNTWKDNIWHFKSVYADNPDLIGDPEITFYEKDSKNYTIKKEWANKGIGAQV